MGGQGRKSFPGIRMTAPPVFTLGSVDAGGKTRPTGGKNRSIVQHYKKAWGKVGKLLH